VRALRGLPNLKKMGSRAKCCGNLDEKGAGSGGSGQDPMKLTGRLTGGEKLAGSRGTMR